MEIYDKIKYIGNSRRVVDISDIEGLKVKISVTTLPQGLEVVTLDI